MHVADPHPHCSHDTPDQIVRSGVREPGVALVQLAVPFMARASQAHTGRAPLSTRAACLVETLLAEQRVAADGKSIMLFVTGVESGTCTAQARDVSEDCTLWGVQVSHGGKAFCFMFLRQDDADAVLGRFGRGVHCGGRMIKAGVAGKGKKKGGRASVGGTLSAPAVSLAVPSTDTKVNNLTYGVDEMILRGVINVLGVSKVIIKRGYAFVSVASSEVEKAVQAVDGKKIGDRIISVKIAERRK
ncbi:hypothetical protein BDU57DRAFT_568381 [Ampelomyces quisqualis]|uniref:RRM domain-containing protein n=1 Tax=Ampelomyces quisqualis TaxID=50730 RepID=A0A6A5QW80_AMPQU|nr:hypothetical protein BDU57DRAFT_568381 [Ampelomyces quisqualis]